MADRMPTQTGVEPSTTSLLSGIVHDIQDLLTQQLQLFKHELRNDMNRAKVAMPSLGLGVALAGVALLLLGFTIAHLLNWLWPGALPLWGCYAIVMGVFGGGGCALLFTAKKNLESLPMSREAARATEENVEWLTKPK